MVVNLSLVIFLKILPLFSFRSVIHQRTVGCVRWTVYNTNKISSVWWKRSKIISKDCCLHGEKHLNRFQVAESYSFICIIYMYFYTHNVILRILSYCLIFHMWHCKRNRTKVQRRNTMWKTWREKNEWLIWSPFIFILLLAMWTVVCSVQMEQRIFV